MKKVTMYTGDPCSFCEAAKALLKTKNVEIEELDEDTNFEIKSIEGQLDDFRIELEDGRIGEFKYGYSKEKLHYVNEIDMNAYSVSPLETMFEFLFNDKVNYNYNSNKCNIRIPPGSNQLYIFCKNMCSC